MTLTVFFSELFERAHAAQGIHFDGMSAFRQWGTSLTITYTCDALNRLTSAAYSDGWYFNYTYDANGNTLQLERGLGPGTIKTTYNYNANQLNTAQKNGNN